jgi:HEAT repeat protein
MGTTRGRVLLAVSILAVAVAGWQWLRDPAPESSGVGQASMQPPNLAAPQAAAVAPAADAIAKPVVIPSPSELDDLVKEAGAGPSPDARAEAVRQLGYLAENAAREAVMRATNDPSPEVRIAALNSLVDLDQPQALRIAGSVIARDADSEVKLFAIEILKDGEDAASLKQLALGLDDRDPEVRTAAASALAIPDQPAATQALLDALRREADPDVRDEIISSLALLDVDVEAAN